MNSLNLNLLNVNSSKLREQQNKKSAGESARAHITR
jgi:hypothetical protein